MNIALFISCTSVALILGSQSPAPPNPPQVPAPQRLSGVWVLNKDISNKPAAAPKEGRGGDPGAGRSGGRRGGLGGGNPPAGPRGGGDSAKALTLTYEIGQSPERLTVVFSESTLSITDSDGVSRKFTVDGKTGKVAIAGYSVEVKSRWVDDAVEQEFKAGSVRLIRTIETTTNGNLLIVTVSPKDSDRAGRFVFVYNRMPL